jgi:hypothetical protein
LSDGLQAGGQQQTVRRQDGQHRFVGLQQQGEYLHLKQL